MGNTGKGKVPKGCKNWFDGCNHCIIKDGKELGCTKMFCGQMYDGPKKKPFCTVFEDGRRCKSATDCTSTKTYNCYTREVWTPAKKAYCCKTKKVGCSQKPKKPTGDKDQSSIPAGCTSWYDGCNTCFVRDGKKLACTKRACFTQGKPSCKRFGSNSGPVIDRVADVRGF